MRAYACLFFSPVAGASVMLSGRVDCRSEDDKSADTKMEELLLKLDKEFLELAEQKKEEFAQSSAGKKPAGPKS